ncbi:MAG: glycosyltransferase [Candidatus Gottesmanbacteria bacterium]|nr:glycosyltransferase [Candidatus Gottesmanbacteria bacterium]
MGKIDLSVVIPAYNEETNIRLGALDKVSRFLERASYQWEAIIVDDGSTDGTRELLDAFVKANPGFSVIHNPHQGKASTVITGMLGSHGSIVLFTDLDQATPITELAKVLPWFEKGYDVVIGSRSGQRQGAPFTRRVMARGFMILRGIILGLRGIGDTQCGFKAFKNAVAKDIFHRLKLYGEVHIVSGSMVTAGFDIEMLFLAKKNGIQNQGGTGRMALCGNPPRQSDDRFSPRIYGYRQNPDKRMARAV